MSMLKCPSPSFTAGAIFNAGKEGEADRLSLILRLEYGDADVFWSTGLPLRQANKAKAANEVAAFLKLGSGSRAAAKATTRGLAFFFFLGIF